MRSAGSITQFRFSRSKVDGAVLTTEARLKAQVVARQARQASSDLCPLKETSAW